MSDLLLIAVLIVLMVALWLLTLAFVGFMLRRRAWRELVQMHGSPEAAQAALDQQEAALRDREQSE